MVPAPSPMCFLEGTQISTPEGSRPIETLKVGDYVNLPNGKNLKIIFIGKQIFDLNDAPEAHPVSFAPNSIAPGVPSSNLNLSAQHGVWNGHDWYLASQLVNNESIKEMENPPTIINFYNIELEEWAAVLAENLACESYRDLRNRNEFHYSTKVNGESLALA